MKKIVFDFIDYIFSALLVIIAVCVSILALPFFLFIGLFSLESTKNTKQDEKERND